MGFYYVILPVEKTNLVTNPSFERGTAGWGTLQGGTVGTTSSLQTFGAFSGSVAPSNNGTAGALSPTFTTTTSSAYAWSVYGSFAVGSAYRIGVGDASGNTLQGSAVFTGGGTWHRYVGSFTESSGASRRLAVRKNSNALTDAFYLDGAQIELGSVTTYLDGDQEGARWLGNPHTSASFRSGTARQGGTVIDLNALGLIVLEHEGIGMAPVTNIMQDYAIRDGALFQRQRATPRAFVLTGLLSGTTWQGLHALRQQVIDAIKPDRVANQQPTRFLYTGAGGTTQIDALYDSGLGFSERAGFSETAAIRFVAPDPYWTSTTDQGTVVAGQTSLGTVANIARRDGVTGRWGTMGGTSVQGGRVNGYIYALEYRDQTLYVGGEFTSVNGSVANGVGLWNDATRTWGTLVGGTISAGTAVTVLTFAPWGTLFAGGNFGSAGGTVARSAIAQWTPAGAWGTLAGGTINHDATLPAALGAVVYALTFAPWGSLFVGGVWSGQVNGTTTPIIAQWSPGGSWGSLAGGTIQDSSAARAVSDIAVSLAGSVLAGGLFGTTPFAGQRNLAQWSPAGTWGTFNGGTANSSIRRVVQGDDGVVYVAGAATSIGSTGVVRIAAYNGNTFTGLGGTFNQTVNQVELLNDGELLVVGEFNTIGGALLASPRVAQWNGASWIPLDIDLETATSFFNPLVTLTAPDNTLFLGGQGTIPLDAATVVDVVNRGAAAAYPVVKVYNTSAASSRLYQVNNNTTGDQLYFNLEILPNETITIDTRPNAKTLTSDYRGNILNSLLPGSNLSTWRLLPGTNYVSVFGGTAALQASIVWRPRTWSNDQPL